MNNFKKYKASFSLGLQKSMEYRADFILSILSAIFPIVIQIFLWMAIYKSTNQTKVYGYTYTQMLIYTLLAGLISKLVVTGFEYEINEDIKNGGLNKYIVKPINYFVYRLCCFIGSKIFSLLVLGLVISCIISRFSVNLKYAVHSWELLIFILSLVGAIILNFLIYFCISILAFWISEVGRLFGTINIILIVLSGGIFPIDIFGSKVSFILSLFPFKYTVQFPVDVISGKLVQADIIQGILIQFVWICTLLISSLCLWKAGLKKYVAVGG